MHYLTKFHDGIRSSFWVISKITSVNLCKPIHDTINYSTSVCPFESECLERKGKKFQKFEYLKNEKSFLDEIKKKFHSFSRAIIWWKNKNLIKNSGQALNTPQFKKSTPKENCRLWYGIHRYIIQRHIQNPIKHLRRSFFAKIAKEYKLLPNYILQKDSILDVRQSS